MRSSTSFKSTPSKQTNATEHRRIAPVHWHSSSDGSGSPRRGDDGSEPPAAPPSAGVGTCDAHAAATAAVHSARSIAAPGAWRAAMASGVGVLVVLLASSPSSSSSSSRYAPFSTCGRSPDRTPSSSSSSCEPTTSRYPRSVSAAAKRTPLFGAASDAKKNAKNASSLTRVPPPVAAGITRAICAMGSPAHTNSHLPPTPPTLNAHSLPAPTQTFSSVFGVVVPA